MAAERRSVVEFINAHIWEQTLTERGLRLIEPALLEEAIQGGAWFNPSFEGYVGDAFKVGVLYGAMRSTGISLDTIMAILGDTD